MLSTITEEEQNILNGQTSIDWSIYMQGDLLFLGQSATHEIYRAGQYDIAVNFIVLPAFFSSSLAVIGEEETPLRSFLVGCLCGQNNSSEYLHFDVSGVKSIQNLIENLLWTLMQDTPQKRKVCQMTMTLLFVQLMGILIPC